MTRDELRYQAFYCEENVYQLLREERLQHRESHALFISNALKQCPLWAQRAAPADSYVVWDYHVVALVAAEAGWAIWDLDTRLGFPESLADYLAGTFPLRLAPEAQPFAPCFRVVPRDALLATFRSDRSHMRDPAGGYLQPPPSWPAPGEGGSNLMRFVDMQDDIAGEVLSLDGLRRRFAAGPSPS